MGVALIYNLKIKGSGNTLNFTLPGAESENCFVITNARGLTEFSVSLATSQGSGQDGTTLHGSSVQAREIIIDGMIVGPATKSRELMIYTLTPKTELEVIFDNYLYLKARITDGPTIERKDRNAKFQFTLYAEYPYWRKLGEILTEIVGMTPEFEFPINYWNTHFDDPLTHYFGVSDNAKYRNVFNYGNVPARFKVMFVANTELSNPRITLLNRTTPDPFILVNKDMVAGEVITVDMVARPPEITTRLGDTAEDIFPLFDEDSTVFELNPGDNLIQQDTDINPDSLEARLLWAVTLSGAYGDDKTYV